MQNSHFLHTYTTNSFIYIYREFSLCMVLILYVFIFYIYSVKTTVRRKFCKFLDKSNTYRLQKLTLLRPFSPIWEQLGKRPFI